MWKKELLLKTDNDEYVIGLLIGCSLPMTGSKINTRYMPTIGNGYLGATIYDDAIFLNGVFEGSGGQLRALLPTTLAMV